MRGTVQHPKFRIGDRVVHMEFNEFGFATADGKEADGPVWVWRDDPDVSFVTTSQLREHYEPVNLAAYDELGKAGLGDMVPDDLPERRQL